MTVGLERDATTIIVGMVIRTMGIVGCVGG